MLTEKEIAALKRAFKAKKLWLGSARWFGPSRFLRKKRYP
jgi:hypothetical protein